MLFDWDEANAKHIARHGISRAEVEEVLTHKVVVDLFVETSEGETRVAQLGQTRAGRALVVVTTERGSRVRPVTAFEASPRRRKQLQEVMVTYAAEIRDSEVLE